MIGGNEMTFGGSGLDRAAELRGDAAALAALANRPGARWVVMWRGKPLVVPGAGAGDASAGAMTLVALGRDHPLLAACTRPAMFLGRADPADGGPGEGIWVADLTGWEPEGVDEAAMGGFLDPSEQTHPDAPQGARFAELRAIMTRLTPRDAELAVTAKAVFGWHETHGFCARCGAASEMTMAGWQRDCPVCKAHHFPRTDPVVIMLILDGDDVLLGRSPGWPEGMYSLLAGFVEPGETLEAAVRREVFEEAGVRVGDVDFIASQPWPFPASLMFGCSGVALGRDITLDPVEIEDALWVSKDRMTRIFAGEEEGGDGGIRAPRAGAIAHYILANWVADGPS